jgi:hypothetical protein
VHVCVCVCFVCVYHAAIIFDALSHVVQPRYIHSHVPRAAHIVHTIHLPSSRPTVTPHSPTTRFLRPAVPMVVYVCVCACMYECACACVCVCVYMCMYVYTYVCRERERERARERAREIQIDKRDRYTHTHTHTHTCSQTWREDRQTLDESLIQILRSQCLSSILSIFTL